MGKFDISQLTPQDHHFIKESLYRRSLYDFARAAWPTIDPAPFIGGGFAMQAVCDHLEACANGGIRNLIINVPPRFSKSTLTGTLFPAWVWTQKDNTPLTGPGAQFLFASYSQNLALQDSIKCRRLVESDWYRKFWGERVNITSDQNTKSQFDLLGGGRRNTVSVGGSTTGMGGNYLIADDPNNAREANSEAVLESTIEWWDMAWSTRLNDPKNGCRIVIQQRLSEEDITGHILSKDVGHWTHLCLPMKFEPERRTYNVLYPAYEDEDGDFYEEVVWTDPRTEAGELLWPERFGEQEVDLLERTLGPWAAAGQLQQRPEPKGGGIIKRDWWQLWEGETFPTIEYMVAALDTAYTEKSENDFSAMTVWGVFRGGDEKAQVTRSIGADGSISSSVTRTYQEDQRPKVILMFAWQERLELHELVKKVQDTMRRYKIEKLLIENKATGIPVASELRRLYGYEDFVVQLVDPRGQLRNYDKVSRVHSIVPVFADGLVYAPERSWSDMLITQMTNFPKAKHDDLVDTVVYALRHLREIGYLVRGDEWTADVEDKMQFTGNDMAPLYGTV